MRDHRTSHAMLPLYAAVAALVVALALYGIVRAVNNAGAGASAGVFTGGPVHGVRTGMGPADVRANFDPPAGEGRGQWRSTASDTPGEVRLAWQGDDARAPASTFDFHDGLLVAASIEVPPRDPDAQGPRVVVSSATLLARRRAGDAHVELRLLARDCPTHATEVHRLLAER